jgi:hypothetical protein
MNIRDIKIKFGQCNDDFIMNMVTSITSFKTYSNKTHYIWGRISKRMIDDAPQMVEGYLRFALRKHLLNVIFKKQFNAVSRLKKLNK